MNALASTGVVCCVAIAIILPSLVALAQAGQQRAARVMYTIESASTSGELSSRFTSEQIATLEMLNRADARFLPRLDELVVPKDWYDDPLRYSAFPASYAWAASTAKLIVIDQPSQSFAGYESGDLVRWGPISSGREGMTTPAGLFHLTWRSQGRHSTVDPDWFMPWYFNFENERGLSFHEYTLPGRPASHACVRLLERDCGSSWPALSRSARCSDPPGARLQHIKGSPDCGDRLACTSHSYDVDRSLNLETHQWQPWILTQSIVIVSAQLSSSATTMASCSGS